MLIPFLFQVFTSKSSLPYMESLNCWRKPVVSQAALFQALRCRTGLCVPNPTAGQLPPGAGLCKEAPSVSALGFQQEEADPRSQSPGQCQLSHLPLPYADRQAPGAWSGHMEIRGGARTSIQDSQLQHCGQPEPEGFCSRTSCELEYLAAPGLDPVPGGPITQTVSRLS